MLVHNAIAHMVYSRFGRMEEITITDADLDLMQVEGQTYLKNNGVNIGKARVRELLVEYILSEFGISAFGVKEIAPKREISDKMIKKCQKARRKGF